MKPFFRIFVLLVLLPVLPAAVSGCALIDERTKDCPEEMLLVCRIQLDDNAEQEMDDNLGTQHDRPLRAALEDYLSDVFSNNTHEVDVLFYDQRKRGKMTFRQTEVMDAEQKVLELRVPASDYRVAGVSNLSAVPQLSLQNEEDGYSLSLVQTLSKEPLPSHPAAVYAARQRVLVRDKDVQTFNLPFYMTNAAAAVALNRDSCDVRNIRAVFTGLGDTFRIVDSVYSFDQHASIEAKVIDASPYVDDWETDGTDSHEEADRFLYDIFWERWTNLPLLACGVGFPSPNVGTAVIGTYPIVWTIDLYVTLADGSVTRSLIYVAKPLESGKLMIVKGWITAAGGFTPTPEHPPYVPPGPDFPDTPDQPVDSVIAGVDVMINWTENPTQYPEL